MLALIVGAAAALVGILVGFLLGKTNKTNKEAILEQRNSDLSEQIQASTNLLGKVMAQSEARAGSESLAKEREATIQQLKREKEELLKSVDAKTRQEHLYAATVSRLETELKSERDSLKAKLDLLETAKEALANQFQALAAEILDKKATSFSEGSQKELGTLLEPLKVQIKEFREKVEKAQIDSNAGVTKLETLIGALNGLNQQLSEDARNLATALRGSSKTQGDWGEFILRDLLEKAGLREDEQFSFQQSFAGVEEGERTKTARTDVVLFLPGGRCLVIDSKVSLTAYTDFASADTDTDRAAALKQHMASMRAHVASLGKSGYHRLPGIETPDFVVMFVPVEPAFLIALQNDGELWADAYRQGILLVGPTTLLYIIRIVNVLWQQETQARNVKEVMDRGAKLYEKFAGFVADIEEIGKSLRNASDSYEDARKKLSEGPGNLVKQVEMLRQLGVKPRKTLPAKFLETADVEEPTLALATEADDNGSV